MSRVSEIRSKLRIDKGKPEDTTSRVSDLPLDHRLSFERNAGEQWTFRDGHIFINDADVEELIDKNGNNIDLQCRISEALSDYKDEVFTKGGKRFGRFHDTVSLLQNKILRNLKRIYDEKVDGIYISWGEEDFIINNVNLRAFLSMYRIRPTEKARSFLKGIKAKLALLLLNKSGSLQYERIRDLIQFWYDEVNDALSLSPIDGLVLTSRSGSCSR